MEDPQLMLQICVRLDNETLFKFTGTVLWRIVSLFSMSQTFWRMRTECLLGRTLDSHRGMNWKNMYYNYLSSRDAKISPRRSLSIALSCIQSGSESLRDLLDNPNFDITSNLLSVLRKCAPALTSRNKIKSIVGSSCLSNHMPNVERSDSANMIVLDNRISVEDLQISLLRTFVWILREKLIDKILGFMIGSDRVGCPTCEEELGEMIEGKSVYSLLCRYILLKRPKSSDLILWIAEWDHSDLRTATRALAQNIQVDNPSIMAMRELIRVLIQPSLTLEDILYDLGLDNASNETLELTGKLLGLYYGRRSIIEQEMN